MCYELKHAFLYLKLKYCRNRSNRDSVAQISRISQLKTLSVLEVRGFPGAFITIKKYVGNRLHYFLIVPSYFLYKANVRNKANELKLFHVHKYKT